MIRLMGVVMLSFVWFYASPLTQAQTKNRDQIARKDTWQLQDIYPSDRAWQTAKQTLAQRLDQIETFKGKLAKNPETLLQCLSLNSDNQKELTQLFCYASMKSDQDKRVSLYQGMEQQMHDLMTQYQGMIAYIEPEIVAMDQSTLDDFLVREPKLAVYKIYLYNLQRTKAHLLSEPEEKILAQTGLMATAPSSIYDVFSDAELPYPRIQLEDQTEALLNKAGFARYRAVPNRADREKVFDAFFDALNQFRQTFGTDLAAQVKKDLFYARVRKYDSCLQNALDHDNIPVEVYQNLVDNVNKNLDTFYRYLRLKQRMLKVDQLEYYDIYAPVVKGVDLNYTYDQAKSLVLDALQPLGQSYTDVVKKAFDQRWIDVYPTGGKRSGAYSNGSCYDVHPYILMNYNSRYEDVSTLAHELGHTMHSYLSNHTQPYPTADYSIFVAEVASTLNEALLMHKVLQTVDNDEVRLSLLMNYLDGIKGTVFRQTQFAEFELAIHQKAEAGEALTGDSLTQLYRDIIHRYYGCDQGICHIKDLYDIEWAYVPHFYYDFYVYQYATSFTASTALSEEILNRAPGAVKHVLAFLSSGGSDYPINLLKKAGVDMMTSDPFDKTMAAMNRVMDQIEAILEKQ